MIKKAKARLIGFVIWLFLICLGVFLPLSGGYASPGLDDREELEAFISKIISEQLAEHNIPGATLSIVKDGEVVLLRGYGYANLDERKPVNGEQCLFRIGSADIS